MLSFKVINPGEVYQTMLLICARKQRNEGFWQLYRGCPLEVDHFIKVLLSVSCNVWIFSSYWMRLSRIWTDYADACVVHRGRMPGCITPSEICRILHILRKPNSIIVLLFLQNNSKFKNKLKHANLGRWTLISVMHLYRGNFRKLRSAQVYKYAPNGRCCRRVVFLLFLRSFWKTYRRETSKMFRDSSAILF